jgi:hypothetical protein
MRLSMRTSNVIRLLIGSLLLSSSTAFAQPQLKTDDVRTDGVLVCATEADAKNYATVHKDEIQSSIEGEKDAKACLVVRVAYVPGKQSDRIEHKDATTRSPKFWLSRSRLRSVSSRCVPILPIP